MKWLWEVVGELYRAEYPEEKPDALQPPWYVLALLLLVMVGFLVATHAQQPELKPRPAEVQLPVPDVEVHVLRGQKFDYQRMTSLYFAACLQVGMRVHPEWGLQRQSEFVRPKMRLFIGGKYLSLREVEGEEHRLELRLKGWDEALFTAAVVEAATDQVLSQQQKKMAVLEALGSEKYGTISVNKLRKENK